MSISIKSLTKIFLIGIFLITGLIVNNGLSKELYPDRPITMVSPSGPGMGDTLNRLIAKVAEKELGQPIIIENKPGATGTIGMNYTLKSKPDGYTIGANATAVYTIIPNMRKLPYNVLTDVIDIATFYKYNFALAVRVDAPWNTFEEIIQYAKNNPGKFTYSTTGVGRAQHIMMEWIAMKERIKWTHVPYEGAEAVIACLGGHVNATAQGSVDLLPQVKAGKLKLILILENKRWSTLPNVPSMLDKGYNFYAASYGVILAPTGVPEDIIKKLEDVFEKAKRDPSFTKALVEDFQMEGSTLSGKEYSALWRLQYDEIGKVIKALGLQEK